MTTELHGRLKAAIAAVNEANEKTAAHDVAIARLRDAIDAVPQHQGAVNALANADAQAFERYAREGGDVPTIDAKAHDKARIALAGAQAKAQAASAALRKIEDERVKAHQHGEAAQAAIYPLAAQIAIAKRLPELLAELGELQTLFWQKAAQVEEVRPLLYAVADALPKGSAEAHELLVFAEKISNQIREHGTGGKPADVVNIRTAWAADIDATIEAASAEKEGTE